VLTGARLLIGDAKPGAPSGDKRCGLNAAIAGALNLGEQAGGVCDANLGAAAR